MEISIIIMMGLLKNIIRIDIIYLKKEAGNYMKYIIQNAIIMKQLKI